MIRITIEGPQGSGKGLLSKAITQLLETEGKLYIVYQDGDMKYMNCKYRNPDVVIFEKHGEIE